eukprot:768320-Hanusia_phi.AAC.2
MSERGKGKRREQGKGRDRTRDKGREQAVTNTNETKDVEDVAKDPEKQTMDNGETKGSEINASCVDQAESVAGQDTQNRTDETESSNTMGENRTVNEACQERTGIMSAFDSAVDEGQIQTEDGITYVLKNSSSLGLCQSIEVGQRVKFHVHDSNNLIQKIEIIAEGIQNQSENRSKAVKNLVEGDDAGVERLLRDDADCFLADYTKAGIAGSGKSMKFKHYNAVKRAKISRALVDVDPDVELRVRREPSVDAEEVMSIGADDVVEVVGECGNFLRLSGDEERWILYQQDDVVLVDFLLSNWSLGSGWGFGSKGNDIEVDNVNEEKQANPEKESSQSWNFSGWTKTIASYAPVASALGTVSAVSKNILSAGSDEKAQQNEVQESETPGQDLADSITAKVEQNFDKPVELEQGGLASVRVVSQGISMIEGTLGWLGSTAKEKAKAVSETINSDDLMDKAWSGVASGVKASSHAVSSASELASRTTNAVVNSQTISKVGRFGKDTFANVSSTVMSAAGSVLASTRENDAQYPNRSLGGVLSIELSGCVIQRDPHVDDEDEDPFMSDEYSTTPITSGALESIRKLVHERFSDRVYLICVAAPAVQARVLRWLSSRNFYESTGTSREQVHFCREWDEKSDLCKELGVTCAIEASVTGAGILESAVDSVMLFGDGYEESEAIKPREEGSEQKQSDAWWESLCNRLLPLQASSKIPEEADSNKAD